MNNERINRILDFTGFSRRSFPFNYLGVPIFKCKVRVAHLQGITDKMINKLDATGAMGQRNLVEGHSHITLLLFKIDARQGPYG